MSTMGQTRLRRSATSPLPMVPFLTSSAISPSSKPSSTRISRECSPSFGVRRAILPARLPFAHTGNFA